MKFSSQIRLISYLKAHASDVVHELSENKEPMIITQNGEAKLVVLDIESYEQTQETLALFKVFALGNRQIEEGRTTSAKSATKRIRDQRKTQG